MDQRPRNYFRYARFSQRGAGVAALLLGLSAVVTAMASFPFASAQAAAAFPTDPTAVATATELPPKLPLNVVLAKVPWKRDSDHPVKEFVPLATLPWKRYLTPPVPEFVPLATLPWANCHVVPLYMPYRPEKTKQWVDPDYNFIMAMCRDKQGNLWLATEGSGIYRYDPSAFKGKHWTQFTKQNTHGALANNCIYAIACDNHDRIWAGELNHGVSVFNGKQWQDYDIVQNPRHKVLAGPLGDHVYAMKFDRYTDQMWIGTNAGISVYQCSGRKVGAIKHHWHYITQANGLPMNPDAIACGKNGIIYVGTQCGGLAVGTPEGSGGKADGAHPTLIAASAGNALGWSRYQWTVIQGPWHMPLTATGKGLPSNLINAVAVESGGRVVVGTDGGIAFGPSASDASPAASAVPSPASLLAAPRRSANSLRHSMQRTPRGASHWTFEHGRNFVAKVYGLWHPPVHWQAPSGQLLEQLPTEDHTTVAAWQPNPGQGPKAGYLWLGHWRAGLDVWQYNQRGKIVQRWHIHEPQVGNYIESLQPLKGNAMAVGTYGRGAFIITLPGESENAWRKAAPGTAAGTTSDNAIIPPEPRAARPPSRHHLAAMANAIRAELIEAKGQKQPRIVPLPDDWRTEGNWLGHYGKYWMRLFGGFPDACDIVWSPGPREVLCDTLMGPHHRPGDRARRWQNPPFFTPNHRALQLPPVYCQIDHGLYPDRCPEAGGRVVSEADDHGETYPTTWQGPDLNLLFTIPKGLFVLGFYEWNYNGHAAAMRMRDYPIRAEALRAKWQYGGDRWLGGIRPTARFQGACYARRPEAVARAENNWGGEWLRFLVRGPVVVAVRFCRNYSLNTHLLGVAVDSFHEHPAPYYYGYSGWRTRLTEERALRGRLADRLGGVAIRSGSLRQAVQLEELSAYLAPGRYANTESRLYALVLRSILATDSQTLRVGPRIPLKIGPRLARAEYRLGMFRRWEKTEHRLGSITPGQVDRAVRWNHLNFDYEGFEFGVIRRVVKKLLVGKAARAAERPARMVEASNE